MCPSILGIACGCSNSALTFTRVVLRLSTNSCSSPAVEAQAQMTSANFLGCQEGASLALHEQGHSGLNSRNLLQKLKENTSNLHPSKFKNRCSCTHVFRKRIRIWSNGTTTCYFRHVGHLNFRALQCMRTHMV